MSKPEFVYVIYIASTPEKIFKALTDANMSEQYWDGSRVVSDWKIGGPFALELKRKDKDVTFELEQQKDQVRLTIVHDGFEPGSRAFEGISRGWPFVLSSLKSYLEAGKVLHAPWYETASA